MAPVARKILPEEKLLAGLVKGWAYLAYTIKQLIILFPNLWAGYEMGRRKEDKKKNQQQAKDTERVEQVNKDLKLFIESLNLEWELENEWPSDQADMEEFLEEMKMDDIL